MPQRRRNIGEEILQGVRDIGAGRIGRRFTAESFATIRAREKSGLSQSEFAKLLGISVRTLQDWEQGRREPNAAAQTLIRVAEKHPTILRGLVDDEEDLKAAKKALRGLRTAKPLRQVRKELR